MSLVKETVDRLLKGYDIRLRPDFGGNGVVLHIRNSPVPDEAQLSFGLCVRSFPSPWLWVHVVYSVSPDFSTLRN